LRAIAQEQPRSSLDEVTRELFRRAGVKVSTVTVRKALREAGIERLKPLQRYGYTGAHRRSDGPSGMNTDLPDAELALVADLFERDGIRLDLGRLHPLVQREKDQDLAGLPQPHRVPQEHGNRCLTSPSYRPHFRGSIFGRRQ
jgi:hypothetical protein